MNDKVLSLQEFLKKSADEQIEKLEEFKQLYEKDVTNNVLKQLNVKETFKDINFGDPLADPNAKEEGENGQKKAPVAAPFKNFVELQKYLFLNPLKI